MPDLATPAARKTRIPWSQETKAIVGVGAAVVGVGAAVIGVFLTVSLSLNNRITTERNALRTGMLAEHADIRTAMRAEHADIGAEMQAGHAEIRQAIQLEAQKTQEILQAILGEILRLHTNRP